MTESADETITMCDVLQEEQEMEEDANAVLGASDDTNCSYSKGYVERQALYACRTCFEETGKEAGICLACCYRCHDDHQVVELYTKRKFRCDCGNEVFGARKCNLEPNKVPCNPLNKYNHNFRGTYCSCKRPYPDPEDEVSDQMIQCIMCEDWYHGRHLAGTVPTDFFEMICQFCMNNHSFLYAYLIPKESSANGNGVKSESSHEEPGTTYVDVESVRDEKDKSNAECKIDQSICSVKSEALEDTGENQNLKTEAGKPLLTQTPSAEKDTDGTKTELDCLLSPTSSVTLNKSSEGATESQVITEPASYSLKADKTSEDANENSIISKAEPVEQPSPKAEEEACILQSFTAKASGDAAFWPENWRRKLCRCKSCLRLYSDKQCEFLLNSEDTVHSYEEQGRDKGASGYERGMSALGNLDRVRQMEAVRAYSDMKGKLKDFLKDFAENGRTVQESDVRGFFEHIAKKRRLNGSVPHFCR